MPARTCLAIMRAAVAVMGEVGYEAASVRDMAARAGVSVAALYYHFPSKLDLLREFLHEAHDVVLGRVAREIDMAGPSAKAKLDAAGIEYLGPDRGALDSVYFRDPNGMGIELYCEELGRFEGSELL